MIRNLGYLAAGVVVGLVVTGMIESRTASLRKYREIR